MKLLRTSLLVLLYTSFSISLFGEGVEHETSIGAEFAYYFDDHSGYDDGKVGGFVVPNYNQIPAPTASDRALGSGWGSVELQLYLNHKITVPFLEGEHELTEDNNVKFNFNLYVAPVALYGKAAAIFTPIAFLNFEIGGMIGSGWNAVIFNGLGLNTTGTPETTSFPGVVTELWSSATFQFDLAAIVPGEWTHVVLVANGEFKYSYFSGAGVSTTADVQAWQWLADSGENLNGLKFNGTYFLGYQMPLVLDTVGFLVETTQHLGANNTLSTMASNGWGSDFVEVTFGPLANFSFDEHNNLTVLFQFQSGRDYTDATIFEQNFIDRDYEATYVKFHRIALAYNYKF